MLEPSGVAYINGYGPERAGVEKEATGVTTKILQPILGVITFEDSTVVVNFPHCLRPKGDPVDLTFAAVIGLHVVTISNPRKVRHFG